MLTPEDVQVILRLHQQGWGKKRIARQLGISKNTVKRYLEMGQWQPRQTPQLPLSVPALAHLEDWLREQFHRHRGNAVVIHQELQKQHDLHITLRTVQRAVKPLRRELELQAKKTVRFETPPGRQMQADFGQRFVTIGGQKLKVHLAVLTLGFSRRCYVEAFAHERRIHWLQAIEHALQHFGGVPEQILVDNARALVRRHDTSQDLVEFDPVFLDFCTFWGMQPRACRPYRARTKGKVESGVGYAKHNALAGHDFEDWDQLRGHLAWWMKQVADTRVHGTTGEPPGERFEREERGALLELPAGRFYPMELVGRRVVQTDACVEVETNHYSVPWPLIGCGVSVRLDAHHLVIWHEGQEVARHPRQTRRHQWVVLPEHLRQESLGEHSPQPRQAAPASSTSSLQRSLEEYAQLVEQAGGGA